MGKNSVNCPSPHYMSINWVSIEFISEIFNTKVIIFHNFRHKRAADGHHHGSCGLDKYKNWMTSQSEAAKSVCNLRHPS